MLRHIASPGGATFAQRADLAERALEEGALHTVDAFLMFSKFINLEPTPETSPRNLEALGRSARSR
jgi:hypothetical protein